mmetsp:Transcript_39004/g.80983  ORF Transcript_39004/g.80983 Transcript_39004/m.80983 type:complete len:290 (-) Transcript_39004:706-1575(-)
MTSWSKFGAISHLAVAVGNYHQSTTKMLQKVTVTLVLLDLCVSMWKLPEGLPISLLPEMKRILAVKRVESSCAPLPINRKWNPFTYQPWGLLLDGAPSWRILRKNWRKEIYLVAIPLLLRKRMERKLSTKITNLSAGTIWSSWVSRIWSELHCCVDICMGSLWIQIFITGSRRWPIHLNMKNIERKRLRNGWKPNVPVASRPRAMIIVVLRSIQNLPNECKAKLERRLPNLPKQLVKSYLMSVLVIYLPIQIIKLMKRTKTLNCEIQVVYQPTKPNKIIWTVMTKTRTK